MARAGRWPENLKTHLKCVFRGLSFFQWNNAREALYFMRNIDRNYRTVTTFVAMFSSLFAFKGVSWHLSYGDY